MQNNPTAPKRTTAHYPFFSCSPAGDRLFAVREGLSVEEVLEQASCFLAAARTTVYDAASVADSDQIFGAAYLVDMAKAVVDAAIEAINRDEKHD